MMKHTVFNKRQFLIWGYILIIWFFAISVFQEKEWPLFFVLIFVSFFGVFISFISPLLFVFEKKQMTIQYWFGFHEIILWSKVKSIEKRSDTPGAIWFYNYCFSTWGRPNGKLAFFTKSEIAANRTTKRLIRKYWHSSFENNKR